MRAFIAAVVLCIVVLSGSIAFAADSPDDQTDEYEMEPVVINRPVNIQGLTGLIIANSAYTQPAGSLTIGLSGLAEDSQAPDYSMAQGIFTATIGLTNALEVGYRAKVIGTNLGSSAASAYGQGDSDLFFKWRVASEGESMPALALGLVWTFPTGDSAKGLNEVNFEGLRLIVDASSEKRIEGTLLGVYLDAQLVGIDQLHKSEDSPYKERYGMLNGGILFGLSDNDNVQAIIEYNKVTKKNTATLYETDYTGVMPGLRYVTKNMNISLGWQFRRPDQPDAMKDERLIGTISYRF